MSALLSVPRVLDAIMAGVVLEAVALVVYRRRTGRGMPGREVASFLGAGLALLAAARFGSAGTIGLSAPFAGAMAAALACHVWHLRQRWAA
jgi:hypothetical protein